MSETGEMTVEETKEQKLARLQGVWDRRMSEDAMEFYPKVGEFAETLREKYSAKELSQVRLWHVLVGSSLLEGHEPKSFDTPDGEIEEFLKSQEVSDNH
jgi:hypothetical protein